MPITMSNWKRLRAVHDKLVFDLPIDITLTDKETDIIEAALKKSHWLRANMRSLFKLYKWLPRLESGYYDDYTRCEFDGEIQHSISTEDLNKMFTFITGDDAGKE